MSNRRPVVLHQCDNYRITFRDTGSDLLLLSFSPMHWPERKVPGRHWGDRVAEKSPYAWLAIDAMREHWYAQCTWESIRHVVQSIASRFPIRVGYGHSMGAYAALKHSRDYSASTILAFAPQYSIHPDEVGTFDSRYQASFDPALHADMAIGPDDIQCGRAWVFYDPLFLPDQTHVSQIAGPRVTPVPVTYMRHDVVYAAAGSATLTYLVFRALLDRSSPEQEIPRVLRQLKKSCPDTYLANLSYAALRRHHASWAWKIAEHASALGGGSAVVTLQLRAAMALRRKDDVRELALKLSKATLSDGDANLVGRALLMSCEPALAAELLDRPSIALGDDTRRLRTLADALAASGSFARAIELAERAVHLTPDDPHCLSHLARLLIKSPARTTAFMDRAKTLIGNALTIMPRDTSLLKQLAMTHEVTGDVDLALTAWSQVAKAGALNPADQHRVDRLQAQQQRVDIPA